MPEERSSSDRGGAGLGAGLLVGRIAGIDVRLHWTWPLAAVFIALSLASGVFPSEVGGLPHGTYRDAVLPSAVTARVSIEQASTLGWDRYVGPGGAMIGMHTFGSSAPLKDLQTRFGFTPERVGQTAKELIA